MVQLPDTEYSQIPIFTGGCNGSVHPPGGSVSQEKNKLVQFFIKHIRKLKTKYKIQVQVVKLLIEG